MTQTKAELAKTLSLIARAWGRTQDGYCFFPWIDRAEQVRTGRRRAGYHEGEAYKWPEQKEKILNHLHTHQQYDVYWCPNLFEYPERKLENAMDEHALWADLDEVDPHQLDEYPPTIAWETSPHRYQALWLLAQGDLQGASWAGNENQRMTYMIGADASGWDTTQLLRIPGWANWKPDYAVGEHGIPPQGKLLWANGRTYQSDDFSELPEVQGAVDPHITDAFTSDIEGVDRNKVIARIRLKLNKKARDLLGAKKASGDLSDQLWYLTRCLADVGCSVTEIVAIVRPTPWNKFADRADEMRRLITEASKAIAKRGDTRAEEGIDDGDDEVWVGPGRFGDLLKNVKRPKFLVEGLITAGSCGFIAGEPKSFKSWVAMDLAFSVAEGTPFLGHFDVREPGAVLYIQEEDPLPTLKTRAAKIWANKKQDRMVLIEQDGMPGIMWLPPDENREFDPDVNAMVGQGFTISDESWMLRIDDTLAQGMTSGATTIPYKLLIIDTLMMTAGDVEENKSQDMTTRIYRPLKVLSRKHNVTVQVVHHMSKMNGDKVVRPGQRLLGSTANHAWAEDSLYLSRPSTGKRIRMDLESKSVPGAAYAINNIEGSTDWNPGVEKWVRDENTPGNVDNTERRNVTGTSWEEKDDMILTQLRGKDKGMTVRELETQLALGYQTINNRLRKMNEHGIPLRRTKIKTAGAPAYRWILK